MRSPLGVGWAFTRLILHVALGTAIIASYFPFARTETRARLIRWWSQVVLRICGMRLAVSGQLEGLGHGRMLVLNHISWIDVYVVHAIHATRFVAKSEIRSWPVIGYLCDRTGTVFIERGRRHAVHQANQQLADLLRKGACVGVFPEGTTSDGSVLLPFHANLIQAAIEAGVPVQPVAVRYERPNGERARDAAYIGEMSLIESLFMILRARSLIARATLLPPIDTRGRTRHEVARAARQAISLSLGLDTAGTPPGTETDYQGELL